MSDKYDDNNLFSDNSGGSGGSDKEEGTNSADKNVISWSDAPSYSYDPEKIRVSTANSHYSSSSSGKSSKDNRSGTSNGSNSSQKTAGSQPSSPAFVNNNPPKTRWIGA